MDSDLTPRIFPACGHGRGPVSSGTLSEFSPGHPPILSPEIWSGIFPNVLTVVSLTSIESVRDQHPQREAWRYALNLTFRRL